MNKKMKIILSLSILLNLLLIGGVVGGFSKMHFDRGFKSGRIEQRLSELVEVLPAAKSKEFEQRIAELLSLKQTDKATMKVARNNIMQIFEQEPFDKLLYQQSVQSLNQLHQQQMQMRVSLMADIAQYLSPKERKQLSRLIMRRGRRK